MTIDAFATNLRLTKSSPSGSSRGYEARDVLNNFTVLRALFSCYVVPIMLPLPSLLNVAL